MLPDFSTSCLAQSGETFLSDNEYIPNAVPTTDESLLSEGELYKEAIKMLDKEIRRMNSNYQIVKKGGFTVHSHDDFKFIVRMKATWNVGGNNIVLYTVLWEDWSGKKGKHQISGM